MIVKGLVSELEVRTPDGLVISEEIATGIVKALEEAGHLPRRTVASSEMSIAVDPARFGIEVEGEEFDVSILDGTMMISRPEEAGGL